MSFEPESLMASMIISGVGFVLFSYGKKQRRFPHTAMGILFMVYPYFVTSVGMMIGVAVALIGLLFALVQLGI